MSTGGFEQAELLPCIVGHIPQSIPTAGASPAAATQVLRKRTVAAAKLDRTPPRVRALTG